MIAAVERPRPDLVERQSGRPCGAISPATARPKATNRFPKAAVAAGLNVLFASGTPPATSRLVITLPGMLTFRKA